MKIYRRKAVIADIKGLRDFYHLYFDGVCCATKPTIFITWSVIFFNYLYCHGQNFPTDIEAYGDFNYTRPANVALTDLVVRSDCFTVTFLKTRLMAGKKISLSLRRFCNVSFNSPDLMNSTLELCTDVNLNIPEPRTQLCGLIST